MKNNEITYEKAKETLNEFYNVARKEENVDLTCRLSRAMIAFEADPTKDIFLDNVLEEYITQKDVVKNLIERVNYHCGLKFKLESEGETYILKEGTNVVLEGDLQNIKLYLNGVEYAAVSCIKKDSPIVAFFKQKIGESAIRATIKKKARDSYYSQEIRHFAINILAVKGNTVSFQARTYNTCSAAKIGGTDISSEILTYTVDENLPFSALESIVLDAMVEEIDNSIKKILLEKYRGKYITHVNSNLIVNIKEEDLKKYGWTNLSLVTERYTVNYSC